MIALSDFFTNLTTLYTYRGDQKLPSIIDNNRADIATIINKDKKRSGSWKVIA